MGLASTQGKSIRNEPAKCFSTLPLLLYESYFLLSPRNRHLPSDFLQTPVLFIPLCCVVTYSSRSIGNISHDQWTVIAQLSTTHEDNKTTRICCWLLWKHNEKSLFVRTVTSPQVPTVIWFQPWLNVDSPQESWIVGIVCVCVCCGCALFSFSVLFKSGISMLSLDFCLGSNFSLFRPKSYLTIFVWAPYHPYASNQR